MNRLSLRAREAWTGAGFVAPAIALIVAFGFLPLLLAFYISLFDFPLLNPARREFVGVENYLRAFADPTLRRALLNTFYYALWEVPIQTALGLGLALLVQRSIKGVGLFRAAYYLPVVLSTVVASTVWRIMLDANSGLINSVLSFVGLPRQPFLLSTSQALPTLAAMLSWKWVGLSMLILLAGLQEVPSEQYESAQIDGASAVQRFLAVTLPGIRRPLIYVLVINSIDAFKLFTPIYIITRGGPQDSTITMVYMIFKQAFTYNRLGYASTIAVLLLVLLIALAVVQLRLMRSDED